MNEKQTFRDSYRSDILTQAFLQHVKSLYVNVEPIRVLKARAYTVVVKR